LTSSAKWDNKDMAWIDLEGAVNVRDLGGLPISDGGSTVPGRLLRSENLQELSPRDVTILVDEIGVTTVVDLRSTKEVRVEGPAPLDALPAVRHAHHPVLIEFHDAADTVGRALLTEKAQQDRDRYPDDLMCGHYLGYLEERPDEVVGALRSIATAPGAAIVHCAAGKDRTGVIVALALTIAGVDPEVIVADYVATNDRLDAIIGRLSRSVTYASDVTSRPVQAHAARAETMEAFLGQLTARYGGLDSWLDANGFDDGESGRLRDKLTRTEP
jgi:protein-tyrosine phosphatase